VEDRRPPTNHRHRGPSKLAWRRIIATYPRSVCLKAPRETPQNHSRGLWFRGPGSDERPHPRLRAISPKGQSAVTDLFVLLTSNLDPSYCPRSRLQRSTITSTSLWRSLMTILRCHRFYTSSGSLRPKPPRPAFPRNAVRTLTQDALASDNLLPTSHPTDKDILFPRPRKRQGACCAPPKHTTAISHSLTC